MSSTANLAPGATPKQGSSDPFVTTPSPYQSSQLRYATLDSEQFTSYSTHSPAQARRALEAHLKETERRLQETAKLGNTLLEQKKRLTANLADVENVKTDDEVPAQLRQKLVELEKEYNEVGRESARAFLPKLRASKSDANTLSAQGGAVSPSKASQPSRRQRNTPGARHHDIEFATEISTSLLAQCRQLQAALAEKDETLKETASARAQLETDVAALALRLKSVDERTQNFKDENWNLETKIQELEGALRASTDNEQRLSQSLKNTQTEKSAAHRDLDELKAVHDKALESHLEAKRLQDNDLHSLRRDVATHEADKKALQQKIDELQSNNTELARAVSYRFNQGGDASTLEDELNHSDDDVDASVIGDYDMSPIKGTPARPGMLESETLKSSLAHAHRTIQNLKSTIHREKSEKLDLRRMLNEARDEVEKRRSDVGASTVADKKKRAEREGRVRKSARLGAGALATTEIIADEPDWEDDERTPSKTTRNFSANMPGAFVSASATDAETTDAFETADELRESATETESFQTGAESLDDDSEELTETEAGPSRARTVRDTRPSLVHGERTSYLSTASISSDEEEHVRTPSQSVGPKYRLRVSRSARRSLRSSALIAESPASNNSTPQNLSKTLGDELEALDFSSIEGTPSKIREELLSSPETQRTVSNANTPIRASPFISAPLLQQSGLQSSPMQDVDQTVLVHEVKPRPAMVDAGVMTEHINATHDQQTPVPVAVAVPDEAISPADTEERTEAEKAPLKGIGERLAGVAGGALAGFGLGRISKDEPKAASAQPDAVIPAPEFTFSSIISQEYEPVAVETEALDLPEVPRRSSRRYGSLSQADANDEVVGLPILPVKHKQPAGDASQVITIAGDGLDREYVEPSVYGGGKGANGIPTLTFGGDDEPAKIISSSTTQEQAVTPAIAADVLPITKPLQIRKQMADEASQTTLSGSEIDSMLRDKTAVDIAKRPGSGGSARPRGIIPTPPLPVDHTEKIAAAAKTPTPASAPGLMGPPLLPASAYKLKRPSTPGDRSIRTMSRDGTTPRPVRASVIESGPSGRVSRKSSVSSFASEIDERFKMNRGHLMYPDDVAPATDPRMIQAITQTMIGEYLWKYTRRAGSSSTSNTRHRRFFWVHPYTRTLYWSEQDPSTTTKGTMKNKSVPIESVRVISDDNVNPPGLHRKSIVLISKSREIVVTAPTSQRHDTWVNALSYLLLRSEQNREDEDAINDEDLDEFNPAGFSFRRSISKMTRGRSRSRVSTHSQTSRYTARTSSPMKRDSAAADQVLQQRAQSSAPVAGSISSQTGRTRDSSRFSSMASRFVPSGTVRRGSTMSQARAGSALSNRSARDGELYGGSVVSESAEDVRQIIERQDRDADMLENVRACCDGKHDVGSLSRNAKHLSVKSRTNGAHHHHHHHHGENKSETASTQ